MKSAAMLADIGIPLAGTLACQVVGFTLEPLGFVVKRLSRLEGPPRLAAAGVPLSRPLERGKRWMNGWKTRGRQRRGGSRGGGREGKQQVVPGSRANM